MTKPNKPGRPKTKQKNNLRTRISVTLTTQEKKFLKHRGDGSVSAGISKLILFSRLSKITEAKRCFYFIPDGEGRYKIIKCQEGVKGYTEMHYKHFENEREVEAEVNSMNKEFYGLSEAEALNIAISTLRP